MGNKLLWWVVFLVAVVVVADGCWEEERNALVRLQASMMKSSNGVENKGSWAVYNESGFLDCCSWSTRITCNLTTGRVIELDLRAQRLGQMDGWSFNASLFLPFKWLQVLILRENAITGWTQNEGFDKLSSLTNLKVLDLKYNSLYPDVLSSLCWISSLETLKLGSTESVGFTELPHLPKNYTMPVGSEKCPGLNNLRALTLTGYEIKYINVLAPLGFGRHGGLINLEELNLGANNFSSSIFSALRDLPALSHLDLTLNDIRGQIEMDDIIALSNLAYLDLVLNDFESFAPPKGSKRMSFVREIVLEDLGSSSNSSNIIQSLKHFSSLKRLTYGDSNLSAPAITYALRNLSTLEYLDLPYSYLNENFLQSIGQMTSLKVLDVAFGDYHGTLPNQGWCELKSIQELALSGNYFKGKLPSCLGNLTSLRWLHLAGNDFTGNIATSPLRELTSIEFLDISFNGFEVPLSFSQFMNHSKLTYLDVGYNYITQENIAFQNEMIPRFQLQFFAIQGCVNLQKLPSFLQYQYELRILAISKNQLSGSFPTWLLENNTRLAGLYARHNTFTGPFKLPSGSHHHLEEIDLSNNKLNGHIPSDINSTFPKIATLNMSQNMFEGLIPSDIGSSGLEQLDLSHNFLSGGVPRDLAITSPILMYLRLSNNMLKGQIFSEDARSRQLRFLYLNGNNFEGPLPRSILLGSLLALDASSNNFSGEIPRWIGDNTRLLQLDLSRNNFEGSIPVEICNLKQIRVLAMSENRLSSSIPSCLSSLPLEHIHLSKNQLNGKLDHVFSNISSLITLDLGYNSFTGDIPLSIGSLYSLNYILLNNNQLEGEIPSQICQLNNLSIIDFSFNKLYGQLLLCLGNLELVKNEVATSSIFYLLFSKRAWLAFLHGLSYQISFGRLTDASLMDVETQVQFSTKRNSYTYKGRTLKYMAGIDLSSNKLTGKIPVELGNLSKILAFNLSHNHLIGGIPETFSGLHEIESLDLSYNKLNGRIPASLLELHSLAIFSVAYNNLSGALPEFKPQFSTFDKSSYEGNPFLCGKPLDDCSRAKLLNTSKNEREESEGFLDMESFYISVVASYGGILMGIAAALFFNSYWRRAWFRFVEELMFSCYYFFLDNVATPFKNRCWRRNLG